eukprot:363074-Chlamydomonas_euryale.AAC.18
MTKWAVQAIPSLGLPADPMHICWMANMPPSFRHHTPTNIIPGPKACRHLARVRGQRPRPLGTNLVNLVAHSKSAILGLQQVRLMIIHKSLQRSYCSLASHTSPDAIALPSGTATCEPSCSVCGCLLPASKP